MQPIHGIVEDVNLIAHTFGHSILPNRVIGNAIFEHVIVGRIPDFVQMVRIWIPEGVAVPAHCVRW